MIGRRLLRTVRCSIAQGRHISTSRQLFQDAPAQPPQNEKENASKPEQQQQQQQQPLSSCPEGTILKGINYLKKLSDPVALPDNQYPEWLWTVIDYRRPRLDEAEGGLSAQDQAALYGKSKKKRQAVLKKMAAMGEDAMVKRVTPDQQTVDMPHDDPFAAQEHRELVKKFAKQRRREAIKEGNFLNVL